MKLAEALLLRADLKKRYAQIQGRITANVLVQEGDEPFEKVDELLEEARGILEQFERIVVQINRTNLQSRLASGMTLTEALARRDRLDDQFRVLSAIMNQVGQRTSRYGRSEIKIVSVVDVKQIREQMDQIASERRQLDTTIQAANWTVDLLD